MNRAIFVAVLIVGVLLAIPARAEDLLIIANPSVQVQRPVPLSEIAAIYLLRLTTWPDGSHIVPVNREATSQSRREFTAHVLHEDNDTLATYWNQMHFMGKSPPVVQESDRAMLAFIRNVPGSVGYIAGTTPPAGVIVLAHVR